MPFPHQDLESVWSAWMPITGALGITVAEMGDARLSLGMPLDPNRNYQGTVFGGSMAALATLAGWSAIWLVMQRSGVEASLLVQDSSIRYHHPARSDLLATAEYPDRVEWDAAIATLQRRSRVRLPMRVAMHDADGLLVAEFEGRYVLAARQRTEDGERGTETADGSPISDL
ncbi:MAG TPA: YiiD C-terminal domain-containing protein [Gemmatimonadales bacterium]|nr:YiiD C-terminal domain-containing protein [Gemmatimonadales bacterium]